MNLAYVAPNPDDPIDYGVGNVDTLKLVMNNIKDGDTVSVNTEIDTSAGNAITATNDIDIELNENIVCDGGVTSGIRVNNGGKVDLSGNGLVVTTNPYDRTHASGVIGIYGDGEIVFNGSGIEAVITDDPVNKGQFGVCSFNDAKVTINDGNFVAGWYCLSGNGSTTTANAVTTINGGVLESVADYAIYHPHAGKLVINGGDISGAAGAIAANNGIIEINGGTLSVYGGGDTGDAGDGTGGLGNAAINLNARYGPITCTINGGTFIATGDDTILITTGTKHAVNLTIKGGKFSSRPNDNWIPEGYACTNEADEDGFYTVYKL